MIRAATNAESMEIMKSKGVIERFKQEPREVRYGTPYVVNDRMLLLVIGHGDKAEAHIAEPRKHWKFIHNDIDESMTFIRSLGYNEIYTNVTETLKTTLNLLAKHGFKPVEKIGNEVILKWA